MHEFWVRSICLPRSAAGLRRASCVCEAAMQADHILYYMMQVLFFPAVILTVELLRYVCDSD